MEKIKNIPLKDFFYMPGEFENHKGCWMLWPERADNWRLGARPAQEAFISVAKAIAKFEPVTIGVNKNQYNNARTKIPNYIRVVEVPNDDSWARDSGPTFVVNKKGKVRGIDWKFNAWGGIMYSSWKNDKLVAKSIIKFENIDYYKADVILEGGSVNVDGEGTLITTEECLLNPNRNSNYPKKKIEKYLKEYTGVKKIIWLKKGIYKDEASGHVDNLCCFVRPGVVVLLWTNNKSDPQYKISRDAYKILRLETDAKGRKLKVYKIHQPNPIYRTKHDNKGIKKVKGTLPRKEGQRLPASYINFYIANGGIVMPIFNDPYDEPAFKTLQKLFSDRKIVKINSREIILGGGGIHCITRQVPK